MSAKVWTYEALAQVGRDELENILLTGTAPDLEALNGYIYCGWNHEWIGHLSGKKFKKGFMKRHGKNFGFNEIVIQDGKEYLGEWKQRITKTGKPEQLGYFRTSYVKDEPKIKLYEPYRHLAHFNYDINGFHKLYHSFFRVIRDFVVCPNEGDNTLMLCKAYLRIFPFLNIFYCYFLLGHREKITYHPW